MSYLKYVRDGIFQGGSQAVEDGSPPLSIKETTTQQQPIFFLLGFYLLI